MFDLNSPTTKNKKKQLKVYDFVSRAVKFFFLTGFTESING